MEPIWIEKSEALVIHDEQLAEHGGSSGVRDMGLLESALARPLNALAFGSPDLAAMAAAYAFGIARNHPFIDGNKRTAFVVSLVFLALNGHELDFDAADGLTTFERLAAGEVSEQDLAEWFRRGMTSVRTDRPTGQ